MAESKIFPASKNNASTRDIIQALARIVPVATAQAKKLNFEKTGNILEDAANVARYVNENFKYVKDGFSIQKIKLPEALEREKTGDCKSFSLFVASVLSSFGYENGFRYAAYQGENLTHVYNFVVCDGKKYTFDSCLANLKESPRHTNLEDMRVQYIAETPFMVEDGIFGKAERKARQAARKAKRAEKGPGGFKKIALAPVRAAFLLLVKANFRSIATKLSRMPEDQKKGFWNKVGGKFDVLQKNVNNAKDRAPFLGKGKGVNGPEGYDEFIYLDGPEGGASSGSGSGGGGGTSVKVIAGAVVAAAPILIAVAKLFKKNGIPEDEGLIPEGAEPLDPTGEGFEASDPEESFKTAGKPAGESTGFKPSPMLIGLVGVGLVGAYFLLTPKKGKK